MKDTLLPDTPPVTTWSTEDADALYHVSAWGAGYFSIGAHGEILVDPDRDGKGQVSLAEIVRGLRDRGYSTPLVLRFSDVLKDRFDHLAAAFRVAIEENAYQGRYHAVYPIKVNQQRHVVDEIVEYGARHGFGLEVGSKPELLAVMPMTADAPERPIICNGFKDARYIEAVILATKLGRNIIPVVEGYQELELIIRYAEKYGVRPRIGVRVKLASQGVGRWRESSGHRSKFGLQIGEVLRMTDTLAEHGMLDCLKLLHCHVGSQIHNIRLIKNVINELGHIYAELHGLGAGLEYLDIGGGLGIDYDGSQSDVPSSMNYSLEEYAGDIVFRVANLCNQAGIPHPNIISESGRAMVAHHSVLVFNVLGSSGRAVDAAQAPGLADWPGSKEAPQPVLDLIDACHSITSDNWVERWHDINQAHDEALDLFSLGYLDLRCRAFAERLFWTACTRLLKFARADEEQYDESGELEALLSETVFCNFSLFQSMPDSWAIDQLFPIVPLHRLDEEPTRRGVLADITCDSDGKVDSFVSGGDEKRLLELHPLREGEEYDLGAFLVGAYQETLGDLHNLFGDTHVAHIGITPDGLWTLDELVPGDTTHEVLGYVQYQPERLAASLRRDCERAVRDKVLTLAESRVLQRFYEEGLRGYTYLEWEQLG
jgi:arginine decarboxylase